MPKDNFSVQSKFYAKYRPHYPEALYAYLYGRLNSYNKAWDCATGNGQVAQKLAERFEAVIATDISTAQLKNALSNKNITYKEGAAENSPLDNHSVDLITVGQAIHWFDHDLFFKEVQRVSKPKAILSYWSYGLMDVSSDINHAIRAFHDHTIADYWDPEREIWKAEYRSIQFPLNNFERKDFEYITHWDINHLEGYLNSWSAVQHFIKKEGVNPVPKLISTLNKKWDGKLPVRFPVFLYAGVV